MLELIKLIPHHMKMHFCEIQLLEGNLKEPFFHSKIWKIKINK